MAKKFVNSLYEPVVQTKYGKLRGFVLDGIFTWHTVCSCRTFPIS